MNKTDIYDTYKDLYLSKEKREEKLLQGIQSTNGLMAWAGERKVESTAITVTTQENTIKKNFG